MLKSLVVYVLILVVFKNAAIETLFETPKLKTIVWLSDFKAEVWVWCVVQRIISLDQIN